MEYCEYDVLPRLGQMYTIVNDFQDMDKVNADHLKHAAKLFNDKWKSILADINSDVLKSFSSFRNGAVILQASFQQLISFYQKFLAIWGHKFGKGAGGEHDVKPVVIDAILTEIKAKYSNVYIS